MIFHCHICLHKLCLLHLLPNDICLAPDSCTDYDYNDQYRCQDSHPVFPPDLFQIIYFRWPFEISLPSHLFQILLRQIPAIHRFLHLMIYFSAVLTYLYMLFHRLIAHIVCQSIHIRWKQISYNFTRQIIFHDISSPSRTSLFLLFLYLRQYSY